MNNKTTEERVEFAYQKLGFVKRNTNGFTYWIDPNAERRISVFKCCEELKYVSLDYKDLDYKEQRLVDNLIDSFEEGDITGYEVSNEPTGRFVSEKLIVITATIDVLITRTSVLPKADKLYETMLEIEKDTRS